MTNELHRDEAVKPAWEGIQPGCEDRGGTGPQIDEGESDSESKQPHTHIGTAASPRN
jgi:hypothetical protein